jgi:uncharacterized membrane protein YGL010W
MNHTIGSGGLHEQYPSDYSILSAKFSKYHKNDLNILLHFVTTPLGFLGAFGFVRCMTNSSTLNVFIVMVYLTSLFHLPLGTFLGTCLISCFLLFFCRKLKLGMYSSLLFLVLGYTLQDVAHFITGEETFQESYSAGGHVRTYIYKFNFTI